MEFTWNSPGIHLESIWNPSGVQWNYGIHLESSGMVVESFHVESRWTFQMEFGHSMWSIDGMESPKRVGSQPKYIPSGMSGIHLEYDGFYLDSIWIPCGIHGESKDLPECLQCLYQSLPFPPARPLAIQTWW